MTWCQPGEFQFAHSQRPSSLLEITGVDTIRPWMSVPRPGPLQFDRRPFGAIAPWQIEPLPHVVRKSVLALRPETAAGIKV